MARTAKAPVAPIDPHVKKVAIVIVLGAIMSVLDTTIVNVALDTLSRDLDAPLSDIQWVATGYLLSLAAVIPITGWASTRFGARRLYVVALIVFTAGSALCGLAWSSGSLIAFRVIQGIGGGMIMPVGQMILVRAAGPKNLSRIMSLIGVPIILAPVFGPTVGGLLLEHVGWQSIFLINVPIGVIALWATMRLLPKDLPGDAGKLDAIGLGLVAVGVTAVTYGLAETGTHDLGSANVVLPIVVGLVLVGLFVARALRIPNPLLNVRLYGNRAFAAASLTTFALGGALFGAMVIIPLYFQTVRGEDAVSTGLLVGPQGIGAMVAMGMSGRLSDRFGAGRVTVVGVSITAVATIPFMLLTENTSYGITSAAMIFRGLGVGLSMMPAMTAAFSVLKPSEINHASPQLNTLQRVGGSIGVAVLTVVLQRNTEGLGRSAGDPSALAGAFGDVYWWVLAVTVVALIPAVILMRVERRRAREGDGDGPAAGTAVDATPEERQVEKLEAMA
ncbi:DHA2 family efflux MFS transporter permease subunit [Patulibacter sp.]|uniref:DHA2 family efflux MFS transporter permease subunit n=1 Tax=Patulibacter sp. TaxID=1912859 RepID=UPI0027185DB8|nr:DHA2 family efflux MFS transporter permease subunit [Patulibacter sp.]MDO9406784.1 DHA2 family efflux MFS transporter permease subunit [Patulibacter sp.]